MAKHTVIMLTGWASIDLALAPGDAIELEADVAHRWVAGGLAQWPPGTEPPARELSDFGQGAETGTGNAGPGYKELGGGWYLLPNGEKIHGKAALDKALAALDGSAGQEGGA